MTPAPPAPSEGLPPWPDRSDYHPLHVGDYDYYRALSAAYEARLRVAVEAFDKIARIADAADEDEADDALTDVAGEVMAVTLRIGPLPASRDSRDSRESQEGKSE